MSHSSSKKSVFDRIGGSGGSSSSSSGTTNTNTKSTHGFCNAFIKTGTCPLGDTCKFIHEQPNLDKSSGTKDEFRITKTITRIVDMSSPSIKSTVTVSNEQRPVVVSNSTQSSRTVVESVAGSTDHSDRRSSNSDHKKSGNSDSKSKSSSSSKKSSQSSSHDNRHSSSKTKRSIESDSPVSSASDSEYSHTSHKHKKKSDTHSNSSKYKKHEAISPNPIEEATLNDQLSRHTQSHKSPKRTIVITERIKEDNNKHSKTKPLPDIEFLGSKKVTRDQKSTETIHQQAENNKKSIEVKREKKSPSKSTSSTSDQQRRHSSSTNTSSTSINEKTLQIKIEDPKQQSNKIQNSSERSDPSASQLTPPIVQLSPTPPIVGASENREKGSIATLTEPEKTTPVQPPSPICVILDDDSSPAPSIDKKETRQTSTTPVKKSNDNEKNSSKTNKRSRESDKSYTKEKATENSEIKRKRLNDGSSRKPTSSSKNENNKRPSSNRSDVRRSGNTSSRDEGSSRTYKDKSESKRSNESKDRNTTRPSSKSRNNNDRRDTTRSTPDKKRPTYRRGKERGLENVTDSEEHFEEPILPKQTALEAYMAMDWSSLSRDKRIPLNTQTTSRIARTDYVNNSIDISERLLTNEQKEKLNGIEFQSFPLTNFFKQLQTKSTSQIVNSCNRRFGSCAKDMIDMRHKWFTKSIEPVQQYEFINKEHYIAYQQAINSLLDKTSTDAPAVQIETITADVLLS